MNAGTLFELFIISLELLLFFIFIHSIFDRRKKTTANSLLQFLFLGVHMLSTYICNVLEISSLITILLALCMDICFTLLFYKVSIFNGLFYGIIYSSICMVAEYITLMVPHVIGKIPLEHMLVGGAQRIPISLTYVTLIAVLVFLFVHLFTKSIHLSWFQKVTYTLLSVIGIAISHYNLILLLSFSQNPTLKEDMSHLILVNVFFLIMLLSLLVYIYLLGKSKEENIYYLKQEKLHELEEQQYKLLLSTTNSLRTMKHDIKQHLSVIKTLSENQEVQKLQEYVNSYCQELEKTNLLLSTGNTAIDCLVSSKLSLARQLNIPTNHSIMIPSEIPMDDISLSSVIGNLLDNAIENSIRSMNTTEGFTPWIHFYIKPFQNMIILHVENKFDGLLKLDANHKYLSLKAEGNHGLGLNRVSELVLENNGIMTISTEQQIFSVHIILPQKEED